MSDAVTRARELLAKAREEIDQLKARIAELEAGKPAPGPWLRGDELKSEGITHAEPAITSTEEK